jgi:hypothetical protein
MSVQRSSLTEPFALARVRETFGDWFESPPQYSQPLISLLSSLSLIPSERVVVRGEGELAPPVAGALAGALAGPTMLATSTILAWRAHRPIALATILGEEVSRGVVSGAWAAAFGCLLSLVIGTASGAAFGLITRRLRLFLPALAFAVLLCCATWTVVQTLLLRHYSPGLARALPYLPMMLGAMSFGVVLALEVPLRTRLRARHENGSGTIPAPEQTSSR